VSFTFPDRLRRRLLAVAGVAALSLGAAACGSDSNSSSGSGSGSGSGTGTSAAKNDKPVRIAYLSFAVANSYDAPMLAAAKKVAQDNNAEITVFDAKNDAKTQFSQLQNATAGDRFDAVITQPIFGTGLVVGVQDAIAKGTKVVNMDQILGEDLSTSEPQVKGLSGNISFVPTEIGRKLGKLAIDACASKNLDPCEVGYVFSIKASGLDVAIRKSFDEAVKGSPVKVVAEGEGFFQPSVALKAVQNMLQADPNIDAIIGADQTIQGAEQALPGNSKVLLIGFGGSEAAKKGVLSGKWYGDVAQLPATEGRLATEAAIAAVRDGKDSGGADPVGDLPNEGIITKDNAAGFNAEWPG
jgi:ribose transport system substrate-binding protein